MITEAFRGEAWLKKRRQLDRAVAVIIALVMVPAVLVTIIVLRRHGSPVIIGLPRAGINGIPFRMWKFRTMIATGSDGSAVGSLLTRPNDSRVLSGAEWIRRFRLDELPQLVNVAQGDMALVGPRPEALEYVRPNTLAWGTVLRARPGITGAAQIITRHWEMEVLAQSDGDDTYVSEVLPMKLAIDKWYIEHATPALDLVIIWSTFTSLVLSQRTALHRKIPPDLAPSS